MCELLTDKRLTDKNKFLNPAVSTLLMFCITWQQEHAESQQVMQDVGIRPVLSAIRNSLILVWGLICACLKLI